MVEKPLNIALWLSQFCLAAQQTWVGLGLSGADPAALLQAYGIYGDCPALLLRICGVICLLSGAAVLLPSLLRKTLWLTPFAALMLTLRESIVIADKVCYGFFYQGQILDIRLNIVLLLLALFVARGRDEWLAADVPGNG